MILFYYLNIRQLAKFYYVCYNKIMETLKRNLQESIVLQNVFISCYPKMQKEKDKAFFKFVRNYTKTNYTVVANEIIREVSVNLVKEIMVLINQMWVEIPERFNEGLIKERTLYNEIKSQISNGEKLPFNNRELFKRIRQCIAHNSENIQNFVYDLDSFKLNLGEFGGKDYVVHLSMHQMINLFGILFKNIREVSGQIDFVILKTDNLKTRKEIFENIKIIDKRNNTQIDLDENQIDRFYNFFNYLEPGATVENNETKLGFVCSLPNNVERLMFDKIQTLKMMKYMDAGSCWNDLGLENKIDNINTYLAIISNLLFTLVSSRTNDELESLLDGCVEGLNKDKIRHLRNSLCHGRYFHDYNTTFYFYDGRKTLDFELKLSAPDINKILDRLAKGNFEVTALK